MRGAPESTRMPPRARRQPLNSLATRIILFVFVSTFATALVVSWLSIQSTHTYLRDRIEKAYPASLERANAAARSWLLAGQAEIEALAVRGERATDLEAARARSAHFAALLWLGPDGELRARSGDDILPPAARRRLAGGDAAGLAAPLSESGAPRAVASAPLGGGRGRLVGIFDRERLAELLAREGAIDGGQVVLADAEGDVVVPAGGPRRVPLRRLEESGASVHEYVDGGGRHVLGSARPLGLFGWRAVLETPFRVAYAPVLRVVTQVFVVDLFVILLFSFLAYRITSAVVRPIETLSEGARRIAQGHFELEIEEPGSHDEIGLLTRTFNDMMRRIRRYQQEIEEANTSLSERNAELQQANEVLAQLSITDGLTKLHNHRFFQDHLTREIKRVNRVGEPLSMLFVDIDDFKSLNDRLGHAAGDELLARIARIMNAAIRESDLLARYGGEEFVVLASATDLAGAYRLAEKIRTAIAEASFILDDSMRPVRVTVSVGVAQYKGNRKKLFLDADRALYRAKAEGKNCAIVDDEEALRSALEKEGGAG